MIKDKKYSREKQRKHHIILVFFYSILLLMMGIGVGVFFTMHIYKISFPPLQRNTLSNVSNSKETADVSTVQETLVNEDQLSSDNAPQEASDALESENVSTSETLAQEILRDMTLTDKVYQMFITTQEQLTGESHVTQSGDNAEQAIHDYPVGGVIYFEDNIQSPEQCSTMIQQIQSYSRFGLFIAVDEEGGSVARLGNNSSMGTTAFPSMSAIGSTGDTSQAYSVGQTIGREIARYGFNLDFAPVADVNSNPNNPVIGDRAFSSNAEIAADMVAAAVTGFQDSGMLCTLKHFPGHGDTNTDSHSGYTEINKSLKQLQELEFVPFKAGIDAGAELVMVGHLAVPQVTGNSIPASLSKTIIDILKNDLSFEGLVITDSMTMGAITNSYSSSQAAVMAVEAGVDMILMPADLQSAVEGIINAVKNDEITESRIDNSVLKILQTKINSNIIVVDE